MRIQREPAPEVIKVPLDDQGCIACDLVCSHCLYNLRGLESGQAACPECGLHVAESQDQYKRYWVDETWVGDELAGRFVFVGIILCLQLGKWGALGAVLIQTKTRSLTGNMWALAAWAMVIATLVVGMLAYRRYLLRSPISFGGRPEDGGIGRWRPCLVEMALLAPILIGIYGSLMTPGRYGWMFNWLLFGAAMVALTWEQWLGARGLIDMQGRLSSKPSGAWVWWSFLPSPVLIVGWVWIWEKAFGPANNAPTSWLVFEFATLIAGILAAASPAFCVMALAMWKDKWMQAAMWTRTRARKAGEMPAGFGVQAARFFWMQRFLAWFFERRRARAAQKSHRQD
jgi:hypothetical protein